MSDDLVKMARERAEAGGYYSKQWDMLADRIEKLETALQKVLARCSWYEITLYNDVEEIIRKALEEKND